MVTLGLDIGSSSIKASLYDVDRRSVIGSRTSPSDEMDIFSPSAGWAEQDPKIWWHHVKLACEELQKHHPIEWKAVGAIGIAYQMHGLVTLDKKGEPVRPAIIWCDSRAVETGRQITERVGRINLLQKNLNTAGNFTASKMVWMTEHEKAHWDTVQTVLLPGDYIAYRLSGNLSTSKSGLSEMALWNFVDNKVDDLILNHNSALRTRLPAIVPNIGVSTTISSSAANELGLSPEVVISYRAGDQPNNAFGLGVFNPGSVAVNAGTSGVVYAVTDKPVVDGHEVFNPFLHVNDTDNSRRIGLLFCLNGCGIMNAQIRRLMKANSYEAMNDAASMIAVGADGLRILPFGNGSERMLGNRNPGASVHGWDLVRHKDAHFFRASLEGIAAALTYGIEHMRSLGVEVKSMHAGKANLFLSKPFCDTLASMAEVEIFLYDSDGASSAAKGAAYGAGYISMDQDPSTLLGEPELFSPTRSALNSSRDLRDDYFDKISSTLK